MPGKASAASVAAAGVLLATLHEALQMENAAADRVLIIIT